MIDLLVDHRWLSCLTASAEPVFTQVWFDIMKHIAQRGEKIFGLPHLFCHVNPKACLCVGMYVQPRLYISMVQLRSRCEGSNQIESLLPLLCVQFTQSAYGTAYGTEGVLNK